MKYGSFTIKMIGRIDRKDLLSANWGKLLQQTKSTDMLGKILAHCVHTMDLSFTDMDNLLYEIGMRVNSVGWNSKDGKVKISSR